MKVKVVKIATMAAGSRQQSRFISMINNYDKTVELIGDAYNSAGASQEQYAKTLDTMESKLAKLKNAWDEFTMSIANEEFIKPVIDALTNILQLINSIISGFSGGSGLMKTVMGITTLFGGLKLGKGILDGIFKPGQFIDILFNKNKGEINKAGEAVGKEFSNSVGKTASDSKAVDNIFTRLKTAFKKKKISLEFDNLKDSNSFKEYFSSLNKETQSAIEQNEKFKQSFLGTISFDNENQRAEIEKIYDTKGALEATKAAESYGKQISLTEGMVQGASEAMKNNWQSVGDACVVAGVALQGLSAALNAGGYEEASKAVSAFSTSLMAIPVIMRVISAAATALGATLSGGVTLAISAVMALIMALVQLGFAFSDQTSKLDELKERTEKMADSAQQATENYNSLKNSIDSIESNKEAFEGLTQGTLEWNEQLLKANQAVLDLINKYPILLDYLETGAHGELNINEEGFDALLSQQQGVVKTTQAVEASSKIAEITEGMIINSDNLKETAISVFGPYDKNSINNISSETFNDFVEAIKTADNEAISEALNKIYGEVYPSGAEINNSPAQSLSDDKLREILTAGNNYLSSQAAYEKQIQAENTVFASGSNIPEALAQQILGQVNENQIDLTTDQLNELIDNYNKDNPFDNIIVDNGANNEEKRKAIAEKYGYDTENLTKEDIISIVSGIYKGNEKADRIANSNEILGLLSKEEKDYLEAMAGGDISKLKRGNVNFDGKLTENDIQTLGFGSASNFTNLQSNISNKIDEIFNNNKNSLKGNNKKELYDKLIDKDSTVEASNNVTEFLQKLSNEGVQTFENILNSIEQGATPEQMKKILNKLNTADLNTSKGINEFIQEIQDLGVNIPTSKTKEWIAQLKEAANIMDTFSNDDVYTNYVEGQKLIKELSEGSSGKISKENYEALTDTYGMLKSDFIENLDGTYTYLAGTNEDLISATKDLINAMVANTNARLENKIETGQQIANALELTGGDISSIEGGNVTTQSLSQWFLDNEIYSLKDEQGKMISGTDISNMSDADAQNLANYIVEAFNQLEANRQLQQTNLGAGTSSQVSINGGTQNQIAGAALNEAQMAGVDNETVTSMAQYLIETNKCTEAEKGLAFQISARNATFNKGFEEIKSSYDDWSKLIDENTGLIKTQGADDIKVFNNLKASMNKMLGTTSDLGDEFYNNADNIALLKKAAEGSEEAIWKLQNAAAQATAKKYDFNIDWSQFDNARTDIQSFTDWFGNIDLPELEPGMDLGKIETAEGDFVAILNQMLENGSITQAGLNEIFNNLGYTVEWETSYGEAPVFSVPTSGAGKVSKSTYELVNMTGAPPKITLPRIHAIKGSGTGKRASTGGSGGSGGSGKTEKWENPYDELYNLTEKINEALRQREKLEREYDRILKRRGATFKEIHKNQNDQLASLKEEIKMQEQLQAGRRKQLSKLGSQKYQDSNGNEKTFSQWGVTKYANYNESTGVITIDWNAIDKITDTEKGGAVEAYISKLEEISSDLEESQKTLEDLNDRVAELKEQNLQDYLDFEQSVYDALVNQRQKEIDNYQSLSDNIADTNNEILDKMRESIDLERQIRDNTKTEEDINEKEARLAFLRRDTSNSNLLQIKQLEKELSDARESYGDSLVDQQLNKISQQNTDAQDARNKQIELLQAQLDYDSENGNFWSKAYEIIQTGFSSNGDLNQASQLWNLLKEDQNWRALSHFGQIDWSKTISQSILAASNGYSNWQMYEAENITKTATATDKNGKNSASISYNSSTKKWSDRSGNIYNDVDYDSNLGTFTYGSITYAKKPQTTTNTNSSSSTTSSATVNDKKGVSAAIWNGGYGWGTGSTRTQRLKEVFGANNDIQTNYINKGIMSGYSGSLSQYSYTNMRKKLKGYKTGGLADFTGMAWLDGTKTKPELVLNSRDTENFIELKNILENLFSNNNPSNVSNNRGDNYFDIKVTVDGIGNDYDVDSAIEKVKEEIYRDASYRNVNVINFIR